MVLRLASGEDAPQFDRAPSSRGLAPTRLCRISESESRFGIGKSRKEPARFDSFRFRNFRKVIVAFRFGSVWQLFIPVRCSSACVFRTRNGSVRFGSVRFRVRFGPLPKSTSSVRFGRFGSVSYSFLNIWISAQIRGKVGLWQACTADRGRDLKQTRRNQTNNIQQNTPTNTANQATRLRP